MIVSTQLSPLLRFISTVTNNDVLVLRGYEHMPEEYSNDVDIFLPEELLEVLIASFKASEVYLVKNIDQRLGLLKLEVSACNESIKLDILYGFYYFGLEYYDKIKIWQEKRSHVSGAFAIPQPQAELSISLYKEILHNGRIRNDKLTGFQSVSNEIYHKIMSSYISLSDCKEVESFVRNGTLSVLEYRRRFLPKLIYRNILINRFDVFKNIMKFLMIKYVKQEEKFFLK